MISAPRFLQGGADAAIGKQCTDTVPKRREGMYTYGVELMLWTEIFTEDHISLIENARKLGFDGVEIYIRYPDRLPVQKIKDALRAHDMKVCFVVILPLEYNPLSEDSQVREASLDYFTRCIDTAYRIAGSGCVIGGVNYAPPGFITGKARTDDEWERSVEYFRLAARHARERGVTLAVEPLNRFETFFLNTAADAVRFCKDVDEPNAKVHLDTYHMIREEKDFYKAIVESGPYVGLVHACENDRGTPGTGLVQWEEVYRGLKDIEYHGWIVIESFVPEVEEIARLAAVWRKLAPNADHLAGEGLKNLRAIEQKS
jgi:D-psicose/D-tagatose/L-ribulose 3-epimerase